MIRIATQEELPQVVELVKQGIGKLAFTYPVNEETLADSIYRSYIVAPQFVVVEDDKIVGVASMTLNSFPWSQKPYLTSNMIYVLKKYRKRSIISGLYKAIKKYAELQSISYCDSYIGMDKIDARLRLVRSQGLEQTGISIMYDGDI